MNKVKAVAATWLVSIGVVLVLASAVAAQGWTPFNVEEPGRYEFQVERYEYVYWEETAKVLESFHTLDIRGTGQMTEDGQPIFDVTTSMRRNQSLEELQASVSMGAFSMDSAFTFGNPFMLTAIVMATRDLDFEVGERLSLFGVGRVSVVDEATIAGRKGVVVQFEQGEAGDRRLFMEWVVDRSLPFPLRVREYDQEGNLVLQTTLVRYERN